MKLKIAIIDSGIDKNLKSNIAEIRNYTDENEFDLNGHGTCTYNYITKYCSNIEIIICKILNRFGKSSNKALINSLTDLISTDIDIICMPISFVNLENNYSKNIIHKLLKELNKKNTIVICSYKNGSEESFPADDNYTIGVYGGYLKNNSEFWYANKKIVTNIYPECIRTLDNKRCFFSGNSKACALGTVILINKVKILDSIDIVNRIDNILQEESICSNWQYDKINRDIESIFYISKVSKYSIKNEKHSFIKEKIVKNLKKYLTTNFFNKQDVELNEDYYNLINNMDLFINFISKELSIEISDKDIFPYDFVNLDYLVCAVNRWIKNYEKS